MDIDLGDYVAGGYFVVKYCDDGFWRSDLMPERVISLSGCIGNVLDIMWGWNINGSKQDISDFGISELNLKAFQVWCGGKDPGGLQSLEIARQFIKQFLPHDNDVLLVGAMLHRELVDDFVEMTKGVDDPLQSSQIKRVYGVHYGLAQRQVVPSNGQALGYEVISLFDSNFSCSWLCSNLQQDMYALFGIRPNQYGLINNYEDAKKVYEWIAEDKQQGFRAEPLPYHPWLLVQYPIE
jgi:hypothetical protein